MKMLTSFRYARKQISWHETFEEAAITAVDQIKFDSAYPSSIVDGAEILWENDGIEARDQLRDIVKKARYRL